MPILPGDTRKEQVRKPLGSTRGVAVLITGSRCARKRSCGGISRRRPADSREGPGRGRIPTLGGRSDLKSPHRGYGLICPGCAG